MFAKILDGIDGAVRWLSVALAAAIILILTAQIVFRYALNDSIVWSEEVSTWCMIWLVFLGSATIMHRWDHVQVPLFLQWLPMSVRPYFIVGAKAMTLLAVCLIAYYAAVIFQARFHIVSQTTGVSTRWIKLSMLAGSLLMALFALRCIAVDIVRIARGERAYFETYGDLVDGTSRPDGNR
jgi:TRAP-type C4-dicarboxylate transport system permease small subunit